MNFRQRFEAWHKKAFGYCTPPKPGFTAFDCTYPDGKQQARWEGWQANSENSYQLGHNAGVAHHIRATRQFVDHSEDLEYDLRYEINN